MIDRRVLEFMKEILNGLKNQSSYERFEVSKVRVDRSLLGFCKAAEIFLINSASQYVVKKEKIRKEFSDKIVHQNVNLSHYLIFSLKVLEFLCSFLVFWHKL